MSLDKCIPDLVATGKLTREQGARAAELYGRYQRSFRATMAAPAADALASEAAVAALERQAAQSKRQKLLQVSAQKRIIGDVAGFDGGSGKDPGGAALALLDHDGKATYANVEGQRKAIVGRAHAMMTDILFKHSRDIMGRVRKPAELADLVRAAFGEAVDSAEARELADAWGQTAEMLRMRFNAAGGAIGRLEKWGLPQSHDSGKVRAAGFDAWRAEILPRLDPARMIDEATGEAFTAEGLEDALKDVFATIRSEGLNKLVPGGQGAGKLANSRAEHRFFAFKSADDWTAYAERFGTADPFDAMMGHISGMARDIAHMEVLGPNPAATVKWLQDGLKKAAAIGDDTSMRSMASAAYHAYRLGQMFDTTSGALSSPVNPRVAYTLGTVRSLLTSSMLGSASLSAISDVGFQATTRAFNGLPVTGALTGYFKLLNPAARADRRIAVRLGLIAQEASNMASAQNRYLGDAVSGEIASRLAEGVLRASGLSAWTQAGRWAFGMELLGHLADRLDDRGSHAFDKLDPLFRGLLERYGIGEDGWEQLRATPLFDHEGSKFLRPADVADQALGDRLLRMVHTETSFAIPEATARARSFLAGGPPGSLSGEFARNVGLFKSFGVSMMLTHGRRAMEQQGWNRAMYTAGLVVTTTLLGAMSVQLRQIRDGKDPLPMDGGEFWGKASLQGGGFGMFGDYLVDPVVEAASGNAVRPSSIAEGLAGPVAGAAGDALDLATSPIKDAVRMSKGQAPQTGRRVVRDLKRYTPGSSLWYTRLAQERLVWDQLQRQIDPDYGDAWQRMERRAASQDQDYWWHPGEAAPERAPASTGKE